ncbi:hypothetical protein GUITHDRAFT_114243 [Guillardia theta CCMP2712]|uniref:Ubiquitin-like domain-containing protein n=1 Tax=Guillardia theta (strain CCMP2712) TaxID=905079 RepID=L1IUG4_GUITC|nr:hypothetical protein GUITHDRAFT_114243 [Guillardia theta CCMP2712]EKX39747.1 hypothetical protein GUITHDRAFT_114243 [Guillardia theta CCMP2712]|eukprot:XP_005826727.1 hypothetical protein GUITHDRAFT_114243 [Guillardia theta CCMP2712]
MNDCFAGGRQTRSVMRLRGGSADGTWRERGTALDDVRAYRSSVLGETFFLLTSKDADKWYGCPHCQFINEHTSVLKQHILNHTSKPAGNCSALPEAAWKMRAVLAASQGEVLEYVIQQRAAGQDANGSLWVPFSGQQQEARMRRQREEVGSQGGEETKSAEKMRRISEGEGWVPLVVKVYNQSSKEMLCLNLLRKTETTIQEIKEEVRLSTGIPSELQRAVCRGRFLRNGSTLQELAVSKEGGPCLYIIPEVAEDAGGDESGGREAKNESLLVKEDLGRASPGSLQSNLMIARMIQRMRNYLTGENISSSPVDLVRMNESAVIEVGGRRLNVTFTTITPTNSSMFDRVLEFRMPALDPILQSDGQLAEDVRADGTGWGGFGGGKEEGGQDNDIYGT